MDAEECHLAFPLWTLGALVLYQTILGVFGLYLSLRPLWYLRDVYHHQNHARLLHAEKTVIRRNIQAVFLIVSSTSAFFLFVALFHSSIQLLTKVTWACSMIFPMILSVSISIMYGDMSPSTPTYLAALCCFLVNWEKRQYRSKRKDLTKIKVQIFTAITKRRDPTKVRPHIFSELSIDSWREFQYSNRYKKEMLPNLIFVHGRSIDSESLNSVEKVQPERSSQQIWVDESL